MGGYAAFVWPAYFFALGLTFFLYKRSIKQLKAVEKKAEELGLVSKEVSQTVRASQTI